MLALLAVTAFAAFAAWAPAEVPTTHQEPAQIALVDDLVREEAALMVALPGISAAPQRANYRYSVIPGGAYTPGELAKAVADDPVVAMEYGRMDATRLKAQTVEKPRMVHVSYRLGDKVYWTKKKIQLNAGETILSDGTTQIRGRCGNCVSEQALGPTSDQEPDTIEMDLLVDEEPVPDFAAALAPEQGTGPAGGGASGLGAPGTPFGGAGAPGFGAAGAPGIGGGAGGGDSTPSTQALQNVPVLDTPGQGPPSGGYDSTPPSGDNSPSNVPPGKPGSDLPALLPPELLPPGEGDEPGNGPPGGPGTNQPTVRETSSAQTVTTPEPATMILVGGGISALVARRMRARRKNGES